jgi:hypothetical protein
VDGYGVSPPCVAIIPGGLIAVSSLKRHMERALFLQTAEGEEGGRSCYLPGWISSGLD